MKKGSVITPIIFIAMLACTLLFLNAVAKIDREQASMTAQIQRLWKNTFDEKKEEIKFYSFARVQSYDISKTSKSKEDLEEKLKNELEQRFGDTKGLRVTLKEEKTILEFSQKSVETAYPLKSLLDAEKEFDEREITGKPCEEFEERLKNYLEKISKDVVFSYESLSCQQGSCTFKISEKIKENKLTEEFPHHLNSGKPITMQCS